MGRRRGGRVKVMGLISFIPIFLFHCIFPNSSIPIPFLPSTFLSHLHPFSPAVSTLPGGQRKSVSIDSSGKVRHPALISSQFDLYLQVAQVWSSASIVLAKVCSYISLVIILYAFFSPFAFSFHLSVC